MRNATMKPGETLVEFSQDGDWMCGVVVEATRDRLVIAVEGVRAHRAYIQRQTGNWRYIPDTIGNRARRTARITTLANWSKQ